MHEYFGEYTVKDYLLANRLHYFSMRSAKILSLVILIFLILPITAVIEHPDDVVSWGFIVFFLILLGYPYTILPFMAKYYFAKQKQIHGQVKITLSEDRITETSQTGESTFLWLDHYIVSERMILLYNTPKTFSMLPRRFIGDDTEFEYIEQFLDDFPTGI